MASGLCFVLVFCPQGMWDLRSLTRDKIYTPCIGRRSLSHWTTREVPQIVVLLIFKDKWIRSGLTRGCWLTSCCLWELEHLLEHRDSLIDVDWPGENCRQLANESISTQHTALHAMKIDEYLSNEKRTTPLDSEWLSAFRISMANGSDGLND